MKLCQLKNSDMKDCQKMFQFDIPSPNHNADSTSTLFSWINLSGFHYNCPSAKIAVLKYMDKYNINSPEINKTKQSKTKLAYFVEITVNLWHTYWFYVPNIMAILSS